MSTKIFNSKYPILEACMNKGSTLQLALAVHKAGAYPSLCSWTYQFGTKKNFSLMHHDLESFSTSTNSNNIHVSFELSELINYKSECLDIIKDFSLPTIEIIYNIQINQLPKDKFLQNAKLALGPIKNLGVKVFRRILFPVTEEEQQLHYLDGFCVKGNDAAGTSNYMNESRSTLNLFLEQKKLTPNAIVIPYGGIGSAQDVKQYLDLGAEVVAVGTVLAACAESPIKSETKLAMVNATKQDIVKFVYGNQLHYTLNALPFDEYDQVDDPNHTKSLVSGLYNKNTTKGHVYVGHGIDHIKEILPCKTVVENLCSLV